MQDETDRGTGLRGRGAVTNPSATSAPRTAPWIYQYTAQLGY